jgi:hypothetical protein
MLAQHSIYNHFGKISSAVTQVPGMSKESATQQVEAGREGQLRQVGPTILPHIFTSAFLCFNFFESSLSVSRFTQLPTVLTLEASTSLRQIQAKCDGSWLRGWHHFEEFFSTRNPWEFSGA